MSHIITTQYNVTLNLSNGGEQEYNIHADDAATALDLALSQIKEERGGHPTSFVIVGTIQP